MEAGRRTMMTAALIRARARIATPDAVIAATGVVAGCDILVANDKHYHQVVNALGDGVIAGPAFAIHSMPRYLHLDDFV